MQKTSNTTSNKPQIQPHRTPQIKHQITQHTTPNRTHQRQLHRNPIRKPQRTRKHTPHIKHQLQTQIQAAKRMKHQEVLSLKPHHRFYPQQQISQSD